MPPKLGRRPNAAPGHNRVDRPHRVRVIDPAMSRVARAVRRDDRGAGDGQAGGQVLATSVSTSYVATGSPAALVTTASQRTSP